MKLKTLAFLLILALFFLPSAATQHNAYQPFDRTLSKKDEAWIRNTLKSLTLDEKIGQMFLTEANVVFWNRESEEFKRLRHQIVDNKVGGVLVFRSEVLATALSANRWQEMAKVPLLISSDLEMGMGMRFDDTPWWAPNMAVAATGDAKWARLQGEATALQARAMGVNWLFAPTADVNNNPDNPVINTRSFGEDPATVAEFTRAFIEGAQGAGAMACAKHFPGHGDTATDSHIGLPVVDVSRERLINLELIPFRAAITADAMPLLRDLGRNAARLHSLTERIVKLEGHADEIHDSGLKALFKAKSDKSPMAFIIGREIYSHLEKITDRFEDVANEIQGLVLDHA